MIKPIVVSAACVLAGCATFEGAIAPELPVDKVVDHVQCELRAVYLQHIKNYPWLRNWAAGFTLTLQKDDTRSVTPGLDYSTPAPAGRFGIAADIELKDKTRRTLTVKRTVFLKDFDNTLKSDDFARKYCSRTEQPSSPLLGDLGLQSTIAETLHSRGRDDFIGEKPEMLGYRAEFTLSHSVSGGPSWILRRFSGIGFGASHGREAVHTLDFAFTDNSPKPVPEYRVFVTNFPALPKNPTTGQSDVPPRPSERKAPGRGADRLTPDARFNMNTIFNQLQIQGLQQRLEQPIR